MNRIKPIVKHELTGTTTYFNSTKTAYKKQTANGVKYYSYNTVIAFKPAFSKTVYATTRKYSVTTSKQWSVYIVRDIRDQGYEIVNVPQEELERIIKEQN